MNSRSTANLGAAAAKNDTFSLDAGLGTLRFELDVLANDPRMAAIHSLFQGYSNPSDKEGLPIRQRVELSSGATLELDADGTLWYELSSGLLSDALWTDTFLYTARISNGALSTAEVTISIVPPPPVPRLADDTFFSRDTGVDNNNLVTDVDVLANDPVGTRIFSLYQQAHLLEPGQPIPEVTSTTAASGAVISIQPDGTIHYDATLLDNNLRALPLGESWFEQFYYSAILPNGEFGTALARVEIAGVNDAPIVTSNVYFEFTNGLGPESSDVVVGQLEAFDHDLGAQITFALAPDTEAVTQYGSFDLATDGRYSFTLNAAAIDELDADDYAAIPFWVVAIDEYGLHSAPKAVWLYVSGFTPTLVDEVFYASETGVDNDQLVTVVDVLANDPGTQMYSLFQPVHLLDDDEPIPQVTSTTTSSGAQISILPDGTIHYDGSALNYNLRSLALGESWFDQFDYHGVLPTGEVATGTARIEIAGVNDAPIVLSNVELVIVNEPGPDSPRVLEGQLEALDHDHGAIVRFGLADGTEAVTEFGTFELAADGRFSFTVDADAMDALAADDYASVPLWVVATDEYGAQSAPKAVWLQVQGSTMDLVGVTSVPFGLDLIT